MYNFCMAVLTVPERRFLHATASLGYCNPFLPERIEWERAALGREYLEGEPIWSVSVADPDADLPNIIRIYDRLGGLIEKLHGRLSAAPDLSSEEMAAYEEAYRLRVLKSLARTAHSLGYQLTPTTP